MDLSGKIFWRLKVLRKGRASDSGKIHYFCECECWNVKEISSSNLVSWHTKSCWCLASDLVIKRNLLHGLRHTRQYWVWNAMKNRCDNNKNKAYKYYGGKWITYDKKWNTFEWFWEDMNKWFWDNMSIDRIDGNWNYCKENCRWSTKVEQCKNKSNTLFVEHNWEKKCLQDWIILLWVNRQTIQSRIYKQWYSPEEALFTKINSRKRAISWRSTTYE
jgi:hypothetical protein